MVGMIACLSFSYFAITRYRLDYALSASIPLILLENRAVYACCAIAGWQGIYCSQTEGEARTLSKNGIIASAELIRDAELLTYLLDTLRQETHRVEIVPNPQHPYFLIEIPLATRPAQIEFARILGRSVRAISNQTPSIAIAPTPFSARTIARMTRSGYVRFVEASQVLTALAAQPLTLLPLSDATRTHLHGWAIDTVGAFACLPAELIATHFGQEGKFAHDLARGRDGTPIRP
jgi:protein ImuB